MNQLLYLGQNLGSSKPISPPRFLVKVIISGESGYFARKEKFFKPVWKLWRSSLISWIKNIPKPSQAPSRRHPFFFFENRRRRRPTRQVVIVEIDNAEALGLGVRTFLPNSDQLLSLPSICRRMALLVPNPVRRQISVQRAVNMAAWHSCGRQSAHGRWLYVTVSASFHRRRRRISLDPMVSSFPSFLVLDNFIELSKLTWEKNA